MPAPPNAEQACALVEREGSLAALLWRFEPDPRTIAAPQTASSTPASVALAKALEAQGWRFVGPTTADAFMQAMGLVDDHVEGCVVRAEVERARRAFARPGGG